MSKQKKPTQPALRNLAAGDVLFREGEVGDYAYQVVKGKIEVCKFNGDEYVTLSILEKNALFGEMALIDKQPRSAMARAVDEAVVKEIDKDALLGYLKNSPQTAFNMMQQLASYARNANEKLSVDAFSSDSEANENEDDTYAPSPVDDAVMIVEAGATAPPPSAIILTTVNVFEFFNRSNS